MQELGNGLGKPRRTRYGLLSALEFRHALAVGILGSVSYSQPRLSVLGLLRADIVRVSVSVNGVNCRVLP